MTLKEVRKLPKPQWPAPRQPVVKCQGCGTGRNRLSTWTVPGGRRLCRACLGDAPPFTATPTPRRRKAPR